MAERSLTVSPIDVAPDHFPRDDVAAYHHAGYGISSQTGTKPVFVVVDVTYEFCGRQPLSEGQIDPGFPKSAGIEAWRAIGQLQRILPAVRRAGYQVIYTRNARRDHPVTAGNWGRSGSPQSDPPDLEIVDEIAPEPGDLVIKKSKPSAFFGTPLASWMIELGADTVFVAGCTTSGCVRATVVDSFSHNLRSIVVMDAVFDRSQTSHEVGLFEMQQKYAGLVTTEQITTWLGKS